MQDNKLRFTKPVYQRKIDSGGMFDDTLSVHEDPDGGPKRFLAMATSGWGSGYGCRYASLEEAKANLERLHAKL